MLTTIKGAIAKKNTNIGDVVAGGRGNPGKVTSRSEFAKDVSGPNGNKSPMAQRLKKSLSQVVTGAVSKSSKGPKEEEPKKPVVLFEGLTHIRKLRPKPSETTQDATKEEQKKTRVLSGTTTPTRPLKTKSKGKNTLVASKTMSIEDIQSALQRAIDSKNPCDVIYLFRNNSKTMNEAVSSNRTDIINLIAKAVLYIEDKATRKTAYVIAKEKKNKEFLTFATNVTNKLAKLKPCTNIFLLKGKQAIGAGDKRVGESDVIWLSVLQDAIKRNELKNVIDVLVNNIQLISQYCKSDNRLQKQLYINKLSDSIKVKDDTGNNIFHVLASDESINEDKIKLLELLTDSNNATDIIYKVKNNKEETAYEIATKKNNETFLEIINRKVLQQVVSTDNSNKSASDTQTPPQSPAELSTDQNLHKSDSGIDSALGLLESDEAKDFVLGAEGRFGSSNSIGGSLSSSAENLNLGSEKETEPQLQEEFPPDAKPLPLLKKGKPKGPSGQRPPSKRSNQLLEETEPAITQARDAEKTQDQVTKEQKTAVTPEPDTGIQGEENKIPESSTWMTLPQQEEKPISAVIPKPDAQKAPEQVAKSPVHVVIRVADTGIQEKQKKIPASSAGMTSTSSEKPEVPIKEEPAPGVSTEQATKAQEPAVIPEQIAKNPVVIRVADTGIKGEENQIPVSSTWMTLPQQEEKPIPAVIPEQVAKSPVVIPEHNAEKVPEQVKEEQAPDTGMTEDNARGQMVLSHQEETPDNEDNESQIEQQTTLSNEDNNEGALFTKQSSNKTSYTTIAIGCAVLAVGCFVAAVIIQSLALLIIGALLVTGAGITSYLTPSTQVESMEINAHVNVEQTL